MPGDVMIKLGLPSISAASARLVSSLYMKAGLLLMSIRVSQILPQPVVVLGSPSEFASCRNLLNHVVPLSLQVFWKYGNDSSSGASRTCCDPLHKQAKATAFKRRMKDA